MIMNPNCLHQTWNFGSFFCLPFSVIHSDHISVRSPKLKFWMDQLELEYFDLLSLFEFLAPWQWHYGCCWRFDFVLRKHCNFLFFWWWVGIAAMYILMFPIDMFFLANVATSFSQMTFVGGSISSVGMSTVEDIIDNHENISDSSEQNGMFVSKVYPPGNSHILFPRHFWRWFSFSQSGICQFHGGYQSSPLWFTAIVSFAYKLHNIYI